jgi:hypothetical protein
MKSFKTPPTFHLELPPVSNHSSQHNSPNRKHDTIMRHRGRSNSVDSSAISMYNKGAWNKHYSSSPSPCMQISPLDDSLNYYVITC